MMMDDADAKEDNTFSDFTLARPRKQNLDDRPRDIQHSASNVLLDALAYPDHRYGLISRTSSKKVGLRDLKIHRGNQGVNPTKSLWGGGQLLQTRYYNNRSSGWVCWPRHPLYRLQRDQYYNSWEIFQPSYLPEIQIWLVSGYSRLIESRKKNGNLQHKSTR